MIERLRPLVRSFVSVAAGKINLRESSPDTKPREADTAEPASGVLPCPRPHSVAAKALALTLALAVSLAACTGTLANMQSSAEQAFDAFPAPAAEEVVVNHVDPAYHSVESGETWRDIAYQFGIPVKVLKEANPGVKLSPGHKLLLPDPVSGKWKHINPPRAYIDRTIQEVATSRNIPPGILKAVAWQESSWEQWQQNGALTVHHNPATRRSPASVDYGIGQINDHFHPDAFPSSKLSFKYNLQIAALILRGNYEQTGNWREALARYNGSNAYPKRIFPIERQQPWARIEPEIALVDDDDDDEEANT